MLSFIRRLTKSRLGIIITMGVLAIIAVAFAAGDITGIQGQSGGTALAGGTLASVGDADIGEAEMRTATQTAFQGVRQQNPQLDMGSFVNQGGYEQVLARTINGLALQEFAGDIGMAVSKRAVDGEIASIPAFQGVNGAFNQQSYEAVLQQQRLTDRQVRADIARDMVARQLIAPTIGAVQMPAQLALPYASLQLERRQGVVGFIPVTALASAAAPTPAELQTYYQRQRARYMLPERRTMRYALVQSADFRAAAKPTDAEVAAAYRASSARFAPTEKRGLTQVVLLDQAAASALAAKVKSGTAIAAAAREAGLEANVLAPIDKASFATAASPAAADAVFAAAQNAIVGPVRSQLGFVIVQVTSIDQQAGKTLAEATPELTEELTRTKAAEAIAKVADQLNDSAASNATFDELVADGKLAPVTTRPLVAGGMDPDLPRNAIDPIVAGIIPAAFAAEPGDSPQIVPIAADGSFAVVAVGQVLPAAPRPLAQIRQTVTADFLADRAMTAARAVAAAVVAKIGRGVAFAQAMRETGLTLPAAQPLDARRAQLAAAGQQVPPPLALMFSMAPKRAKLLEAPNRAGWFVVYLDAIQGGNAAGNTTLITNVRRGIGSVSGRELSEQFTAAVRGAVGVKRDEAAIAKLKSALAGGVAGAN